MATIYLRSTDGSDADNGSTWALAKATLAAAQTAAGAGGTVYVSQSHAETSTTDKNLTSPGTAASPTRVICVNDAAEPPTAIASTATVSVTGAGGDISFLGHAYYYGITFRTGSGSNAGLIRIGSAGVTDTYTVFDTCGLSLLATSGTSKILFGIVNTGASGGSTRLRQCTVTFSEASQHIDINGSGDFLWEGGSAAGTAPTYLFQAEAGGGGTVWVRGVDLSGIGSGCNLVRVLFGMRHTINFENCKLGSSVSITNGSIVGPNCMAVRVTNCDSADTNYRYYWQTYSGTVTHESTIVRTGGASDGTTAISRKMVSSSDSEFHAPLELDPIVIWNESTSSITVTVHIVTDNVTLTDAECWLEVEELGTSGFPLSVIQSDRAADILATPANQTTSTETWTTTGLTTPVKQKLHVTFTPAEKGPLKVRVMLAKASTTVYVCPKAEVA